MARMPADRELEWSLENPLRRVFICLQKSEPDGSALYIPHCESAGVAS